MPDSQVSTSAILRENVVAQHRLGQQRTHPGRAHLPCIAGGAFVLFDSMLRAMRGIRGHLRGQLHERRRSLSIRGVSREFETAERCENRVGVMPLGPESESRAVTGLPFVHARLGDALDGSAQRLIAGEHVIHQWRHAVAVLEIVVVARQAEDAVRVDLDPRNTARPDGRGAAIRRHPSVRTR